MIRFGMAVILLGGALGFLQAQEARSEPSVFFWGSASNTSLSILVGSTTRHVLFVAGVESALGTRDRAAIVGSGLTWRIGAATPRVLFESRMAPSGWTEHVVI